MDSFAHQAISSGVAVWLAFMCWPTVVVPLLNSSFQSFVLHHIVSVFVPLASASSSSLLLLLLLLPLFLCPSVSTQATSDLTTTAATAAAAATITTTSQKALSFTYSNPWEN